MPESRLAFKIRGLDCAEEVAVLRREIGPVVGGEDRLEFDILNGRMTVTGEPAIPAEAIREAVARTGMEAERWREGQPVEAASERARWTQSALTAGSGILILAGIAIQALTAGNLGAAFAEGGRDIPLAAMAAYALAIILGGRYVAVKAWYALRRLRPDMNLLMTVAVVGAVALGDWLEAASVSFLFALSLALEGWSVSRARRAIAALLDLAPPMARVVDPARGEREVPVADVPVGAHFIVKPGERIPLDGRVSAGTSTVNQAPITGESIPVTKPPGSAVFAGTINGEGVLRVESTKRAEDTTLAHIIKLVEAAQSRRSPSEQWVERFARVYTPAVMVLALLVAVVPPLILGAGWTAWFYSALVLLVIACPCALVISTPVSIVASLAAAARAGVLIKGGAFIELPGRLVAIAFDKTGTLSEGRPAVVALRPLDGHSEDDLVARAAALEAHSGHPLALAVMEFASTRGIVPAAAEAVRVLPGQGVVGTFEGRSFWIGSHRYLEERAQETPELHDLAGSLERQGRTVVAIGNDAHVCGLIAIADTVRREAAASMQALRHAGIQHLVLLTGDNQATAESIARQVGIDEIKAELLPADKVAAIEALVAKYGVVAMVGDGINDAPALASASIGIAMGAAGTDAAIEAADIALMSDDLSKLPWLVQHSRQTLRRIRENIAVSLIVKAAFLLLAIAGMTSLWAAIAADMGASLFVVANGLRLLRAGAKVADDRGDRS